MKKDRNNRFQVMHYMSQAVLRQQLKPQLEAQKLSTVCTLRHDEEILHITPTCQFFVFPLSLLLHKTAEPAMGVFHHLTCHKGGGVVHVVEGSGVVANVSRMAFLLTAHDDLEPLRSF